MAKRDYALRDGQWGKGQVTGNGERVKDRLPGREDMVGVTTKDNRTTKDN